MIGPTPNLAGRRKSIFKKFPSHPTPAPGKPLVTYRVPRMPTEKEVDDVF